MADRREYLTAEEVMEHLKVGRTFVYEQARLYLATNGIDGLPCRRFGRLLRFPLDELDAYGSTGEAAVVALDTRRNANAPRRPAPAKPASAGHTTRRATRTDQSALPFTD